MRLVTSSVLLTTTTLLVASASALSSPSPPAGSADGDDSAERRPDVTALAPGVRLEEHTYGGTDDNDRWAVHVYLPAKPSGPLEDADTALGPRGTADRVARALRHKGFSPTLDDVRLPSFADTAARRLGWTVRAGTFPTQDDAQKHLDAITQAGFAGDLRFTAQDGDDPRAPHQVHVLRVDFDRFDGTVETDFGETLNGTETLTDLLEESGALAGTNAQWFYDSAPAGMYVRDGELLGAATQGRGGIAIRNGGKRVDVDAYTSKVVARTTRDRAVLDAVNRPPGVIWNCGGIGGDTPTERPQHDLRCTDGSELVLYTPEWGRTPTGDGAEVVLDRSGRVTGVNDSRGTAVPARGTTIQATGGRARWLQRHLSLGERVRVREQVRDSDGRRVRLTKGTTILQVGPTLVRDGRLDVNAYADGLIRDGADQTFTYNWVLRSNPRTMIGTDHKGRLMLVVVDGRQAGYSEGLGIKDTARLMRRLGAREALNLDGGGSSVMATADDGIVNRPSDETGQRSLGNVLLVKPSR